MRRHPHTSVTFPRVSALLLGWLLATGFGPDTPPAAAAPPQPNVIIVMTDD